MPMIVLNEADVHELLTMRECIAVMEEALASLARGEVFNPLRQAIRAPGAPGLLGLMPAWRGGAVPYYGLKEVCVFPGNPARGLDTHLGAVMLHSGETGELLAVMNASAITEIRTAAVSAVATKLLARHAAQSMAIIGAGVQARSHLKAIPIVRKLDRVTLFSRTREKAERLAATSPIAATVAGSVEEAVSGADIIVTATSSRDPILRKEWVAEGTHINAVGSSIAAAREVDGALMAASSLWVDRRESTLNESGDYLFALREGVIDEHHIQGEIGELLVAGSTGRRTRAEITLFKSLGLAVEDLASAAFLYEKVRAQGAGVTVEF